jgi:bifunctional DNA-binding transcriptional regulator/antitoxin component of YhaV-PrlF toxin-antitoxin module
MHYQVKLSSKNQITLPVDLLKNIRVSSGDVLNLSVTPAGVSLKSMSSIKQKNLDHLAIKNPYNISKKVSESFNCKGAYGEMAVRRYEKYLKNNKRK